MGSKIELSLGSRGFILLSLWQISVRSFFLGETLHGGWPTPAFGPHDNWFLRRVLECSEQCWVCLQPLGHPVFSVHGEHAWNNTTSANNCSHVPHTCHMPGRFVRARHVLSHEVLLMVVRYSHLCLREGRVETQGDSDFQS